MISKQEKREILQKSDWADLNVESQEKYHKALEKKGLTGYNVFPLALNLGTEYQIKQEAGDQVAISIVEAANLVRTLAEIKDAKIVASFYPNGEQSPSLIAFGFKGGSDDDKFTVLSQAINIVNFAADILAQDTNQ